MVAARSQASTSAGDIERAPAPAETVARPPASAGDAASAPASGNEVPPFEAVFHAHAPYVWRALRRLGVREADVDDVCQDVFLVVHRRLETYDGSCELRTWLFGICLRVASDYRRRAYVLREVASDAIPEGVALPTQDAELDRQRAVQLLDAALDRLDEDKRAAFVLHEFEGLSIPQIAVAAGCPIQTAYSRLYAARKTVEETLARLTAAPTRRSAGAWSDSPERSRV